MPFFRVMLHGTGICFKNDGDDSTPCIGFYTSRAVRASSAEDAIEKAKNSVLELWRTEEYVRASSGAMPVLSTTKVEEISFWQSRKIPNAGHTFYTEK